MFATSWHIVTATFAACAVALYLAAFGQIESEALIRFIAVLHVAFLAAAGAICAARPDAFLRPIPAVAGICMVVVAVAGWTAA
jgi:hypothetical protein